LRRFAIIVAVAALLLVIAGGLVTSNDAAQSVPDWPLSYGKLVPPLEGGIRFEFAHRVLAAIVAVLTLILALWSRSRLAWIAVAAVVAQALLGGAVVTLVAPRWMPVAHACLGQLCFGLIVALLFQPVSSVPRLPLLAAAALFAQTILGAAVRHNLVGVIPHIAGAAVATLIVMWAGLQVLMHHMENPPFRRSAMLLLSLTFSQIFLGMGAYMSRIMAADDPQPMPLMISFTVAHVAVGSLAFGAAIAMSIVVGHGGMAVA
jgi:cytochrome c oxidase assembly protein subunit 15